MLLKRRWHLSHSQPDFREMKPLNVCESCGNTLNLQLILPGSVKKHNLNESHKQNAFLNPQAGETRH